MRLFGVCFLLSGSLIAQTEFPSRCPFTYYDETMNSPYLYGEWIYWQPVTQDPMNWQVKRSTSILPEKRRDTFQTESLNFDFTSGFRLGAGYRIGKDALGDFSRPWQIEAVYTQLVAHAASQNSALGRVSFNPSIFESTNNLLPAINADLDDFMKGQSTSNLSYQRCDIEFAWPIWIRGGGVIRLLMGPTLSWIREDWKSKWVPEISNPAINIVDLKWKWWGGGLNLGTDFHLPVGKGLGFFFDAGVSLSIGRMEEKEKYIYLTEGTDSLESDIYRFHSFQPELNCGAGIDYKYWIRRRVLLHLAAGWEFTWWFLLNQFGRVNDPSYSNNIVHRIEDVDLATIGRFFDNSPSGLGFHGLTLRAGLDF